MRKKPTRVDVDLRDQPGDHMPWKVVGNHICPVNDLREHLLKNCWCNPDDDDGLIVHHGLDRRESYERGERQVS